jgi:LPXTG-motif cell wall-anchored protein
MAFRQFKANLHSYRRIISLVFSFIFAIATVILYFAFQSIIDTPSRWLLVPLGIITFSIAMYCGFNAFDWLQKYSSMVLALIIGTFIFFLFLGDELFDNPFGDFNDLLLTSPLATFQTDLTSVISVTLLRLFFVILTIAGVLLIGLILFVQRKRKEKLKDRYHLMIISRLSVVIGVSVLLVSIVFMLMTQQPGFDFRLITSPAFEERESFYIVLILTMSIIIGCFSIQKILKLNHIDGFLSARKKEQLTRMTRILSLFFLGVVFILFTGGVLMGGAPGFELGGVSHVDFPEGSQTPVIGINEACSGVHSFTIFVLCFYVALIHSGRHFAKDRLIPAMIIGTLGILSGNWLRIVTILIVGYFDTRMIWTVHDYAGLIILFGWMFLFWVFALNYLQSPNLGKKSTI